MSAEGYETKIIDGKALAQLIEREVSSGVKSLESGRGVIPRLATILVGDNPASKMYIRLKHKACERVGIRAEDYFLPSQASQEELLSLIDTLNKNEQIHAILLQLPLPKHLFPQEAMEAISPEKDADGFHPYNMGKLMIGNEGLVPCTPHGVIRALEEYNVPMQGKNVVIIGHSNVVGKPMAAMFLNRNATVSVCHVFTDDLKKYTVGADILIAAAGVKHLIKADMVKDGAVIFDVGITEEESGVYGDVDFENVIKKASLLTPVPGGVGPITVAILMKHVLMCAEKKF
jgi:methylenetetrahydrofolate dehydrogenase (NADP+) / methenyltetrahydrofolate cyclohydrolase